MNIKQALEKVQYTHDLPIVRVCVGKRFKRLLVVKREKNSINRHSKWLCKCDCGNEIIAFSSNLLRGTTGSCGCLLRDIVTTHNGSKTRLYLIWSLIKQRCKNYKNDRYKDYGGRGITYDKKWEKFEGFLEDMEVGHNDKLTIDRIDNNGNYCKENCKWATQKEQQNNKRNNHLVTYNGKTQNIKQWSEELNIKYCTLETRIRRGWSIERAITTKNINNK